MDLRKLSFILPKADTSRANLLQALSEARENEDEDQVRESLRKALMAVDSPTLLEQSAEILQSLGEKCLDLGLIEEADRVTDALIENFPGQTRSSILRARVLQAKGDYRISARILEDSLLNEPGNASLYLELGRAFMRGGETARAREVLKRAVEVDSQLLEAYDLLIRVDDTVHWKARKAVAMLDRGDLESAKQMVSLKLKDSSDPMVIMALAEIARTQGDISLSSELTGRMMNKRVEDPDKMNAAAYCLARSGMLDEAIEVYERVIEHDDSDSRAWYGKGSAYFYMSRYDRSLDATIRSLKLEPDLKAAKTLMVKNLGMLDREKEAAATAQEFIQDCRDDDLMMDILSSLVEYAPSTEAYGLIDNLIEKRGEDPSLLALKARNLISQERLNDAMRQLESSLNLYPKDSTLRHLRALTHWKKGDKRKARRDIEAVLSREPRHLPSLRLLLELHLSEGSHPDAVQTADRILHMQPMEINVLRAKAASLDALGKQGNAFEVYKQALSWGTRDVGQVNNVLAEMLSSKRYNDSLELSETVKGRMEHNSMFWRMRGNALYSLGSLEAASDSYRRGLDIFPDDAWLWYSLAMCLEGLEDYRGAVDSYDRAIVRELENLDFWMGKAACLEGLDLPREANKCYDQVLRLKANHLHARLRKGLLLMGLRRYEEAVFHLARANQIKRGNHKMLSYLKECHLLLGNNEELVDVTKEILRLRPDSISDLLDMGRALQSLERDDEALVYFDRALEIRPNDRSIIELKRISVRRRGDEDELRKLLLEVLKADPMDRGARMELADLLHHQGKHNDALRVIEDFPELVEDSELEALRGDIFKALDRRDDAVMAYNRALELGRKKSSILDSLAEVLCLQGRVNESLQSLEDAIFLDPLSVSSHYLKARIQFKSGLKAEATSSLQRLFELDPRDTEQWEKVGNMLEELGDGKLAAKAYSKAVANGATRLYLRMAENNIEAGEEEEALANLQLATRTEPRSQRAWSLLGTLQAKHGSPKRAKRSLRKALRLDPQDREALLRLAETEEALDDKKKAIKAYQRLHELEPKDIRPLHGIARLQLEVGNLEEAMMSYQSILMLRPGDVEAREGIDTVKRAQQATSAASKHDQ